MDMVRDCRIEAGKDANRDEVNVQKKRILSGENRLRAEATLKCTLIGCAERPAGKDFQQMAQQAIRDHTSDNPAQPASP
jgi:hypothetical protein